jgi:uncharacterized lipoprotein YmbA
MIIRPLILLIVSFALTACVNLKPKPDSVRLYLLGPVTASAVEAPVGRGIYIARPDLPTYLEGNRMQYHGEGGELQSVYGARWGEPLQEGIARAISELITQQSGRPGSRFYPWPKSSDQAAELRVQFHQFGATADGRVQLTANWQLEGNDWRRDRQGNLHRRRFEVDARAGTELGCRSECGISRLDAGYSSVALKK